ncbi:hypothetical protein HNE04_13700 [Caenimonas sp. S4]|nr:hypothetical protein [Caenimonas soli]
MFSVRPFQGVEPERAEFLFVGLDANYSAGIERSEVFRSVVEYHENGAAFWRTNGVHHPFLLQQYKGDGKKYHRNFARIGFTPAHADSVGFVELLRVPTVGRSRLTPQDLDPSHLQRIDKAIRSGRAKYTFLSAGVAKLMQRSGAFPWLDTKNKRGGILPVLYASHGRSVHLHLHFSNFGKFQARMDAEARAIASLLR